MRPLRPGAGTSRRPALAAVGVLVTVAAAFAGAALATNRSDPSRGAASPVAMTARGAVTPPGAPGAATATPGRDARAGSAVRAPRADQGGAVHTRYFDLPRPPRGWHVVGALPSYAILAPVGQAPDLLDPRSDQMIRVAIVDGTRSVGTPVHVAGRLFHHYDTGAGGTMVVLPRANGTSLTEESPHSAGLPLSELIAYLGGIRVLPAAYRGG